MVCFDQILECKHVYEWRGQSLMGWIAWPKETGGQICQRLRLGIIILYDNRRLDKTFSCLTDKVQLSLQWLGYSKRLCQGRPSPKDILIENFFYCLCHFQPGQFVVSYVSLSFSDFQWLILSYIQDILGPIYITLWDTLGFNKMLCKHSLELQNVLSVNFK